MYNNIKQKIQIINKIWRTRCFTFGISAKKSFGDVYTYYQDTFYGVATNGSWYLNGNLGSGQNEEIIRKKIDLAHFEELKEGEIDIYVDDVNGILKICIVGMVSDDKEVFIKGINNCGNKDGWVPHLILDEDTNEGLQNIQIGQIRKEMYGKK